MKVFVFLALATTCYSLDLSSLVPYDKTSLDVMQKLDQNNDGLLTLAEIDLIFDNYHTHGGKFENRHEFVQFVCAVVPDLYFLSHYLYDTFDVNNDHHLERSDFDQWFHSVDTNSDGNIQTTEFEAVFVPFLTGLEGQGGHNAGHATCH